LPRRASSRAHPPKCRTEDRPHARARARVANLPARCLDEDRLVFGDVERRADLDRSMAAACLERASCRMHTWCLRNPYPGNA
jgi:hypothetical protein